MSQRNPAHEKQRSSRPRATATTIGLAIGPIAIFAVALIALAVEAYYFLGLGPNDIHTSPEIALTLLLVMAVVILLITIAGFVALLQRLGIIVDGQPLGLPEGSVRAIIALSLVLIFAIMAVFIFYQTKNPTTYVSSGVSSDQLSILPKDEVVQMVKDPAGTFTVTLAHNTSTFGQQLGQQLVTLLGTLVTAIAAFYFGANTAAGAAAGKQPGTGKAKTGGNELPPTEVTPEAEGAEMPLPAEPQELDVEEANSPPPRASAG
jgi:hypothetical protein